MAPHTPDQLLTTKEAADFLSLSHKTLEYFRVAGGGPRFVKLAPKAVRYRKADLDAWVEASARTSTSGARAA
jgi:excisionase family DNA binding protein